MPAADLNKWPHNASSNVVDAYPNWREVYDFGMWPVSKLRQVSVDKLTELTKLDIFDKLDDITKESVFLIINGKPLTGDLSIITPEKLTSLANSSNNAEIARASIDAMQLFTMAANAIATGDLCGAQLMARDRVDLLKWLGNKAIPDAKSIDHADTARNIDRTRRRKFTGDDLKNLSKDELLDIVQDSQTP